MGALHGIACGCGREAACWSIGTNGRRRGLTDGGSSWDRLRLRAGGGMLEHRYKRTEEGAYGWGLFMGSL